MCTNKRDNLQTRQYNWWQQTATQQNTQTSNMLGLWSESPLATYCNSNASTINVQCECTHTHPEQPVQIARNWSRNRRRMTCGYKCLDGNGSRATHKKRRRRRWRGKKGKQTNTVIKREILFWNAKLLSLRLLAYKFTFVFWWKWMQRTRTKERGREGIDPKKDHDNVCNVCSEHTHHLWKWTSKHENEKKDLIVWGWTMALLSYGGTRSAHTNPSSPSVRNPNGLSTYKAFTFDAHQGRFRHLKDATHTLSLTLAPSPVI